MTMNTESFKNNKTQMTIALIAIVAIVATVSTVLSTNGITAEVQTEDSSKDIIPTFDPTNEGFLANDESRSVIIVGYADKENAVTTRGSSLTTTITLTHMANDAASDSSVTVVPVGTIGVIIPEPYSSMYSSQERSEQLRDTGSIIGAINLGDWITFSKPEITLRAGESATITMKIDIPANAPDSLIDTDLPFQPKFEVINTDHKVRIDNSILDVHLEGDGN